MKIVAVIQEKGGVGKTTTATHLAAGLNGMGIEVMLVDAAPQGHATMLTGYKPQPGLYNWLVEDVFYPLQWDLLGERSASLIAGNNTSKDIAERLTDPFKLRNNVKDVEGVMIVDTDPETSALNALILMSTDYVIIPTIPEPLPYAAVAATLKHIEAAATPRYEAGLPPIKLLGILPTMVDVRTSIHKAEMENLEAQYPGKIYKPFHRRAVWSEAARFSQRVWEYNPNSPASAQVLEWVDVVRGQINA